MAKSKTLTGIAASPGFGVARALVLATPETGESRRIAPAQAEAEIARLAQAVERARAELRQALVELEELGEKTARSMVEIELMVLEDPATLAAFEEQVTQEHLAAEGAVQAVAAPFAKRYSQHESKQYQDRAWELAAAFRAVVNHLQRRTMPRFADLTEPVVVVARDLAPHETIRFDEHRDKIAGIATERGGRTSHFAILARTFGIPCVVALPHLTTETVDGEWITVDGFSGTIEIRPSARALDRHRRRQKLLAAQGERLTALRQEPCRTKDGKPVELSANIELPAEVEHVLLSGAAGIGLYRTEFFYLDRPHLPGEEEQFEAYASVAERLSPRPVIIRTMDLGGDKVASYLGATKEANPFLGWRGIRFALQHPAMFRTQLRAIYRAGTRGNLRMMFPMVTTCSELDDALALAADVRAELQREGASFDPDLEIGMMVETPSAVFAADLMSRRVRFFSIGSNDLIQYTLAMDRGNERIAHLYEPLEPAVLRAVDQTVRAGHDADIWVGLCGEMAGDPRVAVLLVGLGLDELSVSPFDVPRVKAALAAVDCGRAQAIARHCLTLACAPDIREYLRRELNPLLPGFLLGEAERGEDDGDASADADSAPSRAEPR
ncbi:MAG TPA: phosphoenolpyruvate--protein phosphotransferase [Candidatus Eisenbacteria bacterium]|nr:phosphoenolpyruvate--protein phosphotransferase [Candidatus Eisenbacteria bacterium]